MPSRRVRPRRGPLGCGRRARRRKRLPTPDDPHRVGAFRCSPIDCGQVIHPGLDVYWSAPTLVVTASEDPSTPPEHAELIAARIPGARLEVLGEAAHLANVERPAEFNRLLEEHL